MLSNDSLDLSLEANSLSLYPYRNTYYSYNYNYIYYYKDRADYYYYNYYYNPLNKSSILEIEVNRRKYFKLEIIGFFDLYYIDSNYKILITSNYRLYYSIYLFL